MDLLWVIVGIVILWKFSSVLTALAKAGRVKAEVMCEEVMTEAVIERVETIESFTSELKDREIKSHQEILKMLKMDK